MAQTAGVRHPPSTPSPEIHRLRTPISDVDSMGIFIKVHSWDHLGFTTVYIVNGLSWVFVF